MQIETIQFYDTSRLNLTTVTAMDFFMAQMAMTHS